MTRATARPGFGPGSPRSTGEHRLFAIPSSDTAFQRHVERVAARHRPRAASEFEARLRRLYPRVLVRERELSGEAPGWYVYRDGRWLPQEAPWWTAEDLPRLVMSVDGWITDANAGARSLLGMGGDDLGTWHFSDFVPHGSAEDAQSLFEIIRDGHELAATILIQPHGAEPIALDLRTAHSRGRLTVVARLAEDVTVPAAAVVAPVQVELVCHPVSDVAFSGYARLLLERMPEPTPDGLALRLRRLYPHARVDAIDDRWLVFRDATGVTGAADGWWLDPDLPHIHYDAQGLILDANEAADRLFGRPIAGHFWQELVTPGTTEQVSVVLPILLEAGVAISRFRMPRADGSLFEFDSFTEAAAETLVTVIRPSEPADAEDATSLEGVAGD